VEPNGRLQPWTLVNPALLYALAAAAAVVAGGLLVTIASPRSRSTQHLLIAFGAGYMVALVFVAMVPHALHGGTATAMQGVIAGYLLVHLTQHVLTPHFHFGEETHQDQMVGRWVGISALLGLLLHAFFDGVAIASGFQVGATLGMLIFAGIVLHKIPEGVTVASIMLASGNSRRSALVGVVVLGAATVLGVLFTANLGTLQRHGLALSAGVTLYVATSNLVPEIQQDRRWSTAVALFTGVALFFAARAMIAQLPH
jgi:zinc transporter ZupT